MVKFNERYWDDFLGVLRKYMQVRGNLSQKDLSEKIGVGISTMSRFLSKKVKEIDEQLVAKIVAYLNIPLHEMVEFVDESSTDQFKNLVQFFKENPPTFTPDEENSRPGSGMGGTSVSTGQYSPELGDFEQAFQVPGEGQRPGPTTGGRGHGAGGDSNRNIGIGQGQREKTTFSLRDKLESLTPRQKAYLSDFLELDMEGKDLVVDLGNSLFRYFRQKGVEF